MIISDSSTRDNHDHQDDVKVRGLVGGNGALRVLPVLDERTA